MTVARLPSTPPPLPTITHHPNPSQRHSPPLLLLRRPRPRRLVADPPNPVPTTTSGDASDVLRLMDALNLPVSDDTYAALLKDSAASPAAAAAALRHMAAAGRRPGTHLANRLLIAFVTAGSVELAREVFDGMPERDSVSWAAMIFGLVATSDHRKAMRLLARMMVGGECRPTAMILVAAIRACIAAKNVGYGEQLHGLAMKHGLTGDQFLASTLVHFYGKLKRSRPARRMFDEMRNRSAVAWTALIGGCTNAGEFEEALGLFKEMGRVGKKKKNEYTFSSVLRACGEAGDGGFHGRQVHAEAIKLGVEFDPVVLSSLFGMYTRLGLVEDATMVLRLIAMEGSLGVEAVKSFCLR